MRLSTTVIERKILLGCNFKKSKTMSLCYLTRRSVFSASHRLYSKHLSEGENTELFGKCSRENGHGHNYTIEVTVKGEVDIKTGGLVMNIDTLKKVIDEAVITKVDHWHLNHDVPPFDEIIPTVENMAIVFWQWLEESLPKGKLYEVKLWETENNIAIYRGE